MRTAAAVLLLALAGPAHAGDWESADSILLGASIGLKVVDWGQTRNIAQRPREFRETNRFLGEHPSTAEVDRYFALSIAGTAGLAYVLPQQYRRFFLGVEIISSGHAVFRNHQIGLRVSF